MHDSIKDVLGGPETAPAAKVLKHIVHRRTSNGGHIFEHHHTHPDHKMEEHAFGDTDSAINHFMQHATDPNPGEVEANSGTPDAGSGAAMMAGA